MVAAPQYAVFKFMGARSGRSYSVDAYLSDVVGALVRFDAGDGASATSPDFWIAPEPVILTDFAIVTGMTDTTKIQMTRNGQPTMDHLRFAMHVQTLAARPSLSTGVAPGVALRIIQRA